MYNIQNSSRIIPFSYNTHLKLKNILKSLQLNYFKLYGTKCLIFRLKNRLRKLVWKQLLGLSYRRWKFFNKPFFFFLEQCWSRTFLTNIRAVTFIQLTNFKISPGSKILSICTQGSIQKVKFFTIDVIYCLVHTPLYTKHTRMSYKIFANTTHIGELFK